MTSRWGRGGGRSRPDLRLGSRRSLPRCTAPSDASPGPPAACGIDRLLEAPKADPALSQAGDGVDQVPQRPAQPVKLPHHEGVAGPELVRELLEDRTVAAGAAGGLGEHPVAAGRVEGVDLELGLLVGGGDAGIAKQMTDGRSVAEPCDRAGCATLISHTSSGRLYGGWWRGSGGCRRNVRLPSAGYTLRMAAQHYRRQGNRAAAPRLLPRRWQRCGCATSPRASRFESSVGRRLLRMQARVGPATARSGVLTQPV